VPGVRFELFQSRSDRVRQGRQKSTPEAPADEKTSQRKVYSFPKPLSEMTDEEIDAWAKEVTKDWKKP
jgi:hypothetical protein